jgi:hypothetical protein
MIAMVLRRVPHFVTPTKVGVQLSTVQSEAEVMSLTRYLNWFSFWSQPTRESQQ